MQLLLHVCVNLQVPCHDDIHLLNVVVDVAVLRVLSLNVLNQLALLRDHVSHFLKVLKVAHPELLLLLHDTVDLLVEGDYVVIGHDLSVTVPQRHPQIIQLGLPELRRLAVVRHCGARLPHAVAMRCVAGTSSCLLPLSYNLRLRNLRRPA